MPAFRPLILPVIVLAGGLGTRLRPVTEDRYPKPMAPVAKGDSSFPFLEYVLAHLRAEGCVDITICIGHLGDSLRRHFRDGRRFGLRIGYDDAGDASTGMRVMRAMASLPRDEFLVVCGDTYHPLDLRAFTDDFIEHPRYLAQLSLVEHDDHATPNVAIDESGDVTAYNPAGVRAPRTGVETGTLAMRKLAFAGLRPEPTLSLTADVYPALIGRHAIGARYSPARFFDIGTPSGYHRFSAFVEQGGASPASTMVPHQ